MKTHPLEDELRALIARKLEADASQTDPEALLGEALGIDSLTGLELMAWVEEHFDVLFDDAHLAQPRTLANILTALDDVRWKRAS